MIAGISKSVIPAGLGRLVAAAAVTLWSSSVAGTDESVREAQAMLDLGKPRAALELVEPLLTKRKKDPSALLVRSTARIMLGDIRKGFDDLEKVLELDPNLRQGWLNLAGLEIAERRFDAARAALLRAQELDPAASDNHLNLGAVDALQGRIADADRHFAEYLVATADSAEAFYQIASNYALAGERERSLSHLERAILADERVRMRARADDRFLVLDGQRLQALFSSDRYRPPADARRAATAFVVPYSRSDTKLLYAVLEALQTLAEPYDQGVEATADWALIWGDFRIKLSNQSDGTGLVQLSAARESISDEEWQRRSGALFSSIHAILER